MSVQVRPAAQMLDLSNKKLVAYVVGLAIGDGNLTNPNKRAVRLRISCDTKYQNLIKKIQNALQTIAPNNKVSIMKREGNCVDVYCYSNDWEKVLGWAYSKGSKFKQNVSVPNWIKQNKIYTIPCLTGLIETDGSVYMDRKYLMVNFVTVIPKLAQDMMKMLQLLGFKPNLQRNIPKNKRHLEKYTIRVSKNVRKLLEILDICKDKILIK